MSNAIRKVLRNALAAGVAAFLSTIPIQNCVAQNLIPNHSFEEHTSCPHSLYEFDTKVIDWYVPTPPQPDYYNACDTFPPPNLAGVPINQMGFQYPRTGSGYAGLLLYVDSLNPVSFFNRREYIAVRLHEPLVADTIYCGEFYVSLCGYFGECVVANVGMYFSVDSVYDSASDTLNRIPQIASDPSVLLTDTSNWMQVGGEFQALGGEQYLVIGNFLANALTYHTSPNSPDSNIAFYYIDDVSVMKCSQVGLSSNALVVNQRQIDVYPNPANNALNVKYNVNSKVVLHLLNSLGQLVQSSTSEPDSHQGISTGSVQATLDVSRLPNGLYTLLTIDDEQITTPTKVMVLH
jgi:hypothetical protein